MNAQISHSISFIFSFVVPDDNAGAGRHTQAQSAMSGSGAAGAALLPPHGEGRAADPTQAGRACLPPCGLPQGPTCAALRLAAAAAIGAMQAKLLAEAEVQTCLCSLLGSLHMRGVRGYAPWARH